MAFNPISSILRRAARKPSDPLNILTFCAHERYESKLSKTGHNFYCFTSPMAKKWNLDYAPLPKNYHILDGTENQIPLHLDLDLVLCHTLDDKLQVSFNIASKLDIPLVTLVHVLPDTRVTDDEMAAQIAFSQSLNMDKLLFISDYSRKAWGHTESTAGVIEHGVTTDFWKPIEVKKKKRIFSVVNKWADRDWCCGFNLWKRVTNGLPVAVAGDNPGISEAAKSLEDLRLQYNTNRIFLNTSLVSPVPTSLLEAMSCGCAIVSTDNCMIPEIIKNGENGFITNDENEMRERLEQLLEDDDLAKKLGDNARKTITSSFSLNRHLKSWNNVFEEVIRNK